MRLQRPDGKVLEIFSSTPPTTPFSAGMRANDKYFTHVALEEIALPLAETYVAPNKDAVQEYAQKILDHGNTVVVKPLDSGHGHGITVNIKSHDSIKRAANHASEYSDKILLQAFVPQAVDVRLLCINFKFVAALVRMPARVRGDGVHTIGQLIELENNGGRRGIAYTKELGFIDADRAADYLGEELQSVPEKGQWAQVLGTANVGTGGETADVTDDVPEWMKTMAEKASKAMDLACCGVDFLISEMPKSGMTEVELSPIIIELNKCPALFIHETPTYGKPQPTTDAYLDYLAIL
jgi:cyanophycin synthetase